MTEDIAPGQAIPAHRHPDAEEIIFIRDGAGLATLAGRESAVEAGALVFMPRNTVFTMRNTGSEPLRIVAVFSRPGYELYMRDISVPDGQAPAPLTVEELTAIRKRHSAHAIYGQQEMDIVHRQHGKRHFFVIERDGKRVAEQTLSASDDGKVFIIDHTEVDESLQGQGIARQLTVNTVEWARKAGVKLVPVCPFAKAIIDRDASLQDVL